MAKNTLNDTITLRSGTVLKNRICKSSMNEALGTAEGRVTKGHVELYRTWALGGAGLLITGNMMVDARHANEPMTVSVMNERDMPLLKQWADMGKKNNTQIWPQLSHPGKQSPFNNAPVSPSALPLKNPMFKPPRALEHLEIETIIGQFVNSAVLCEKAGFGGVQLHGAHGYLISQFLSPAHNKRTDQWGGSLENRMRFATNIYKGIRAATSEKFNVSIKLNSSDFQKGGFSEEDSIKVAEALDAMGMDMIEISGGSWENPVNRKGLVKDSTRKREAYFLTYAEKVRSKVKAALMVTGGFRTQEGMEAAAEGGAVDIVGLARPFVVEPTIARQVLEGSGYVSTVKPITTGIKKIDDMAIMEISWYSLQMKRISEGKKPRRKARGVLSLAHVLYRFWRNGRAVQRVRST
ncbi:MAG: NADH:flavin oxidoreductase/NADH oxidase family protein [Bermanella sp.]